MGINATIASVEITTDASRVQKGLVADSSDAARTPRQDIHGTCIRAPGVLPFPLRSCNDSCGRWMMCDWTRNTRGRFASESSQKRHGWWTYQRLEYEGFISVVRDRVAGRAVASFSSHIQLKCACSSSSRRCPLHPLAGARAVFWPDTPDGVRCHADTKYCAHERWPAARRTQHRATAGLPAVRLATSPSVSTLHQRLALTERVSLLHGLSLRTV